MFFTAVAAGKAGKWVMSKLTLKNIAIFIGILFVMWSLWKVYDWTIERGMAKQRDIDAPKIAALEKDRDNWKGKYETYRTSFKTWVYRSEMARLNLKKQNEELITGLEQRLSDAKKRQKTTRGLINEIPIYIPTVVDFELSSGFVRLYNLSIEGETGSSSSESDRISESFTFDVGAPSGVTLSTFAEYAVDNNAEAVYRGEVIRAWQEWYVKSKEQFDRAQQEAADSIPRVPTDAPDAPPTTDTNTPVVSSPIAYENSSHESTSAANDPWFNTNDRRAANHPTWTWP